jgi:omega-6 fatty acid desaturase (delta-12 desaturase)
MFMPLKTDDREQLAHGMAAPRDARAWAKILAPYGRASDRRGLLELAITIVPFAALWALMWATLGVSYWLTLALAVPAAGFLVRLFIIQHDCSHDSFFRRRLTNTWLGRLIGVLTLTPYGVWRHTHALHHAGSGNLDRRGIGDVETLTVDEYRARSRWGRLCYRLYRHPLILFGLGPAFVFLLHHRLPVGLMRAGWKPWLSTMLTNLSSAAVITALIALIGVKPFLLVHIPIMLTAASVGVWLFYVQHQFEHARWEGKDKWSFHDASLYGSSHYDLPALLRWFTANIGLHHVHHLSSRIPFYRLPIVLRDHPELRTIGRLTLVESFHCVRLALWDETQRRLISFRDL